MHTIQPLDMKFRPSRRLAALLAAAHGLALAALWLGEVPMWLHLTLAPAVAASLCFALWQTGWIAGGRFPQRVRIVPARTHGAADSIELYFADGKTQQGNIIAGSFVAPYLTVVRFRITRSKFTLAKSLVVLPDSLDHEAFRELRVRLKWGPGV